VIAAYARRCTPDTLRDALGFGAAPIAPVIPAVRERLQDVPEPGALQPDEERLRLLDAVSQFLKQRACTRRSKPSPGNSPPPRLGGRPRTAGDPAERVRKAVTSQIRRALDRIGAAHPELGHHLTNALRTGYLCAYRPGDPVAWRL
jgi:hypothetical protein